MIHYYQEIPGWFDFDDLYRGAVDMFRGAPATFVEVGTFMGRSLAFLGVEIVNQSAQIELVSVDAMGNVELARLDEQHQRAIDRYRGRNLRDVIRENLAPSVAQGLRHRHLTLSSLEASREFADESLAFVFIDADHEYESVRCDLEAWWPKVKPGGWFAGHDHTPAFPGVERAVTEFFITGGRNGVRYSRSSWYVFK